VAEERERAVTRLAMVKLVAASIEVEATMTADVACAVVAELEALRDSSTTSSVSADGGTDDELKRSREAAREQATQWVAVHPQGRCGGSPNGRGRTSDASGGGGNLDRRERAGRLVDGDHGLYMRHGSPSPDRYHGHDGIQAIARDVSPSGGWPTLTKTNYVEWATMMRIWLRCGTCGKQFGTAMSTTTRIDGR
jgi:hypothetical protein